MLLAQLPRSAAASGRINDVLITDAAIEDVPHAKSLPEGPGEVRFDNVTCAECVLAPDELVRTVTEAIGRRVPGEFELVLEDPRRP
jgi:hypothetical protein